MTVLHEFFKHLGIAAFILLVSCRGESLSEPNDKKAPLTQALSDSSKETLIKQLSITKRIYLYDPNLNTIHFASSSLAKDSNTEFQLIYEKLKTSFGHVGIQVKKRSQNIGLGLVSTPDVTLTLDESASLPNSQSNSQNASPTLGITVPSSATSSTGNSRLQYSTSYSDFDDDVIFTDESESDETDLTDAKQKPVTAELSVGNQSRNITVLTTSQLPSFDYHSLVLCPPGTEVEGTQSLHYAGNWTPSGFSFRVPKLDPVSPKGTSINLMWVSKKPNSSSKYIVDSIDGVPFEKSIQEQVLKWAVLNPESKIQFWYDSTMATPDQIIETEKAINAAITSAQNKFNLPVKAQNFSLQDIRALPIVQAFPETFAEDVPVYFRADLLRIAAAQKSLTNETESQAFVYADWTVNPFPFSNEFPNGIPADGLMAVRSEGGAKFENSFMVFGNNNRHTLESFDDFSKIAAGQIARQKNLEKQGVPLSQLPEWEGLKKYPQHYEELIYDKAAGVLLDSKFRALSNDSTQLVTTNDPTQLRNTFLTENLPPEYESIWRKWRFRNERFGTFSDEGFNNPANFIPTTSSVTLTRGSRHGGTTVPVSPNTDFNQVLERYQQETMARTQWIETTSGAMSSPRMPVE